MTEEKATRAADPLSVLCLAGGIAALVLAAFSVVPMMAFCTLPLSVVSVLTSVVSGIASLIRTTLKPGLEGRLQALAGLALSAVWGLIVWLFFMFAARAH